MISTDFIDNCQRLSFVTSLLTLGRTSKFVPPSWYKAGGGGGWMEPLPRVLDMLQYFETILLLVESL